MADEPERFDHYMARCLYGPDGFYASGRGVAGRRGDFITSPEVGPLFGAVVARWLDAQWRELGEPDPFVVVDVGTGPGTLLRSLVLAEPDCAAAWQLHGVDVAVDATRSDEAFTIGPEPPELDGAVVIANELLDNMAFRWIEQTVDGLREVAVDRGKRVLTPIDDTPPTVFGPLSVGTTAPWHAEATEWVQSMLDAPIARLLVFDYGMPTTADLAARGAWLRTYRGHGRGHDPLDEPGWRDITTDIAIDQLPQPSVATTQAEFLRANGIEAMVDEGRAYWTEHAAKPDMAAFKMRSRVSESQALLDPDGLGGWLALEWRDQA